MSVLDDDPPVERDGKAGYSTICRRGEHKTCAMAKARCSCACHGTRSQQPPSQERPPVSEATVTPLPSKPVAVPEHRCDKCGKTFAGPNGLAIHGGRAHGTKKTSDGYTSSKPVSQLKPPPTGPAPGATKKPASVQPANERQLLAAIAQAYHDLNGADIATSIDSAAQIIDAIASNGWAVTTT